MFNRHNTVSNPRMVYLSVPVELNWLTREGSEVSEHTATLQVSAGGAIVLVRTAPPVGADVRLTNCENRQTIVTRTAGMRPSLELHILEVALEFRLEDETFWGLELT
jgi:hypothetical protein